MLSNLSVSIGPESRLRHWCSSRYLRISPLHREFRSPLPHSSKTVSTAGLKLSLRFSQLTYLTTYALFTPSKSEQRLLPPYYRGCWHGVSRSFFRRYRQESEDSFVPAERVLHTKILHHPRGVAWSGLRPLPKIPHCCLP